MRAHSQFNACAELCEAMYMQSMISVNDRRNWFLSFDIACDGYRTCNGVKYMVGPPKPVVGGSNPPGPATQLNADETHLQFFVVKLISYCM